MSSLTTLLVLSRKSVSLGDSLWKTTFEMEDLPLLIAWNRALEAREMQEREREEREMRLSGRFS